MANDNPKVKRTDKGTGREDFVTLEYAADKITGYYFVKPDVNDRKAVKEQLLSGACLQTCSYLYEIKEPCFKYGEEAR